MFRHVLGQHVESMQPNAHPYTDLPSTLRRAVAQATRGRDSRCHWLAKSASDFEDVCPKMLGQPGFTFWWERDCKVRWDYTICWVVVAL